MPPKIFEPRPYQREAIETSLDWYLDDKPAHILELPTGAGKTMIAGGILQRFLVHRSLRGLITVPYLDLVDQTVEKLRDYFFDPDEIGVVQGTNQRLGRRITVASVDTLKRLDRLQKVLDAQGGRL